MPSVLHRQFPDDEGFYRQIVVTVQSKYSLTWIQINYVEWTDFSRTASIFLLSSVYAFSSYDLTSLLLATESRLFTKRGLRLVCHISAGVHLIKI